MTNTDAKEQKPSFLTKVTTITVHGISLLVIYLIFVHVVPQFQTMFEDQGGQLPGPTMVIMSISSFLSHYSFICIPCLIILLILFFKAILKLSKPKLQIIDFLSLVFYCLTGAFIIIALFLPLVGTIQTMKH